MEEWADAGFTVPLGSRFDPKNADQVAQMRKILDWCQARGMKLILCDPRCDTPAVNKAGKMVLPERFSEDMRGRRGHIRRASGSIRISRWR